MAPKPLRLSAEIEAWLASHHIVHLLSLPHTPQHNSWSEHGMRELKSDSELGKGITIEPNEAWARLEASRDRLDSCRLRATRGWRTAVEADRALPPAACLIDRERLHAHVACAIEQAVVHSKLGRARRRAVREAILSTLERHAVITRNRGGAPEPPAFAEDDS